MQSPFEGKSFSEAKAKVTLRQRLFKSKGNSFSKAWAKAFDDKGTFNAKALRCKGPSMAKAKALQRQTFLESKGEGHSKAKALQRQRQ
jgi:hypothetical protein